jgi:hypothetical protein
VWSALCWCLSFSEMKKCMVKHWKLRMVFILFSFLDNLLLEILYKITLVFCYIFKVSCLRFVISVCILVLFWQLEMSRVRPLFFWIGYGDAGMLLVNGGDNCLDWQTQFCKTQVCCCLFSIPLTAYILPWYLKN